VEGEGVKKMYVFVHVEGIKNFHAGGVKKWQNSVHVVVECPLRMSAIVILGLIVCNYQTFLASILLTKEYFPNLLDNI
jgi:hypothetical protein